MPGVARARNREAAGDRVEAAQRDAGGRRGKEDLELLAINVKDRLGNRAFVEGLCGATRESDELAEIGELGPACSYSLARDQPFS